MPILDLFLGILLELLIFPKISFDSYQVFFSFSFFFSLQINYKKQKYKL